ncbi:MAG TPA: PIN domain-containing protein [Methylomirabilota bacterium]|nr:PIN domain-containing protein [Methylomirabilota bacterium]
MSRTHSSTEATTSGSPRSSQTGHISPNGRPADPSASRDARFGSRWDQFLVRFIFAAACVAAGFHFHPFGLAPRTAALVWLAFAVGVILFEIRLQRASMRRLIGAAVGAILGTLGALLVNEVLAHTTIPEVSRSSLGVGALLVLTYIGLAVGASKGDLLNLQALGGLFGNERSGRRTPKVLDTSVIIDGRIADICEAQFMDGVIVIPQFVLRELQLVADSADGLKRQRGRRGLEVLQRIQKMPHLEIEIAEEDFPQIADVDLKLIELARRHDAKIVTNDYNLNKVATLQGIGVMNVNQLANALKPVVLPGESMRVFILREGKEYNQGVAYLDDGTMVVVDGAKKLINKNVDITVTSVHQTTAGKMIFGRIDERAEQGPRGSGGNALPVETQGNGLAAEAARAADSVTSAERSPRPIVPEPRRE